MTAYAELQASSNFSFLRGASHPEELVARAAELEHGAIAIADRNTLAGVVRAHAAAKSSDTTPVPPGSDCRRRMPNGFQISKRRNKPNPQSRINQVVAGVM